MSPTLGTLEGVGCTVWSSRLREGSGRFEEVCGGARNLELDGVPHAGDHAFQFRLWDFPRLLPPQVMSPE